jgi:phosphatidylethanolamine/phosphatidyl-N-methylethanolamine N-methyltransferase
MAKSTKTGVFRQFLKRPNTVGAIAPSGRRLAQAMVNEIDWDQAGTIVEYGPGTGAVTKYILERVTDQHDFFAVEINEEMVATLAGQFPQLKVYHESATRIVTICEQHGTESVDAVISGLPWTVFSESLQTELLASMKEVMRPGAVFVTFAYLQGLRLKGARRFRQLLEESFSSVTVSKPIWRNFPPAIYYSCRR